MKNKKADEEKLKQWQDRFELAKADYAVERNKMNTRENYYSGDKTIYKPDGTEAEKGAATTRNIIFELIESQVESSFPTPKVTPYRQQDEENAVMIEDMLRAEMQRMHFEELNDKDERTTTIQGGDFFLVEWDSTQHTHTTIGEIKVQLLHPRKVVPQRGVESLEQSDWVFVELAQTKEYIKRRYKVDVSDEGEENPSIRGQDKKDSDNMVTQVIVYYRNKDGGIGRFSWVNDVIVEDLEDYQAPLQKYCPKCELTFAVNNKECPYCGYTKPQEKVMEYIELEEDIVLYNENGSVKKVIPAYTQAEDEFGNPLEEQETDDDGVLMYDAVLDVAGIPMKDAYGMPIMQPRMVPVMEKTKIPVYKPNKFPLILRKNVSLDGKFLGNSDIDFIRDQQNEINKYITKITEKLQKGGSVVSMNERCTMEQTDKELKIIKWKDPSEAQIGVHNLQVDVSSDIQMMETNYEIARQTLGVTDSFQGRHDSTAESKISKEFSAEQAAGRFESKKVMKRLAYAELYQQIFMYMLSNASEPRSFKAIDELGNDVYRTFWQWEFLEQDDAGEWYWNDRYNFGTDNTGNLAQNREALWRETRSNFDSGAFGNQQDINVLIMYWTMMKELHYPLAGTVLKQLEQRKEQQEQLAMQQQQMMAAQQQMAMAQPVM